MRLSQQLTQWRLKPLLLSSLLLLLTIAQYFHAPTLDIWLKIDANCFEFLNKSLLEAPAAQWFWALMNHPVENWLNLVVMLTINTWIIWRTPASLKWNFAAKTLYFWFFFQWVLFAQHEIFSTWLSIKRASPALIFGHWFDLSEVFPGSNIKVSSNTSFPAGHALVAVYWLLFSYPMAQKIGQRLAVIFVCLCLLLARLYSGAHWITDVGFTIPLALVWYYLACATPIYDKAVSLISNKLSSLAR